MIGVFDSGLGGLSVLRQIRRQLPDHSVLYLADTANVPYGDKPISVVRDLALSLTDKLVEAGAELVFMASGTSTVAGLAAAQSRYPKIPILGTIEAGASAALQAGQGRIGVLSTNATARSLAFTQAVQAIELSRSVIEQGCPRFVPLVENGFCETPEAEAAAREYLLPLAEAGAEIIILGCTHFPFLLPALEQAAAGLSRTHNFHPLFVDPAQESVQEAACLLAALPPADTPPTIAFAATGNPGEFRHFAGLLLGERLPPVGTLVL